MFFWAKNMEIMEAEYIQGDTKKWERLKNPTKIEEMQEKKIY